MAKISRDAFAPNPLDLKPAPAAGGAIDWTMPLELLDGTPLVFDPDEEQPDGEGCYCLKREDGADFTGMRSNFAYFRRDGWRRFWNPHLPPELQAVRNRRG